MRNHVAIASTLAVLAVSSPALAGTKTVGQGKQYATPCAAIAAAQPGDVIEVDAGSYAGDTCAWSTDNLTIRGVGGRAKIDATNTAIAQQKGIFVIMAKNATIEGFEFSHAAISQQAGNNGAGIRHQGLNLTVRNCFFHDNQNGILGGPLDNGAPADGMGEVLIEGSEFSHNGAGDGFSHNMYLNHYAKLTLRYSYSHDGNVGHLVKTRAYTNFILYNRITDEAGTASYEIDVPNAGTTYVIGNVVEQSMTTGNPAILAYGEEGATNPDAHLFVVNNTFVNAKGSGTFVSLGNGASPASIVNNVFFGGGTVTSQTSAALVTNYAMGAPMFANAAQYDFHPLAGSPLVDQGTAPGMNGAQSLAPDHEYVHPLASIGRAIVGAKIDIGAYEFGNAGTSDAGAGDAASADGGSSDGGAIDASAPGDASSSDGGANGATSGDSGGCGCGVSRRADLAPGLGVLALLMMKRMRRRRD